MASHIGCYNAKNATNVDGKPSKYVSTCEICTKPIEVGDKFTWSRRSSQPRNPSAPVTPSTAPVIDSFFDLIMPGLEAKLAAKFDADKMADEVSNIVYDRMQDAMGQAMRVEIKLPSGEVKDAGIQHKQFGTLVKALATKVPVWLAGPSGSGKTTAAMNAAKVLGLEFRYTGAVGDAYALTGYNDAQGRYVRTPFRDAWEHGGLFLWDEVDASDPNALLAFNAALANGTAAFPDGIVPKHPNTVLIAAANTYGHGATHEYVGRMKMDTAFLKRFVFMSWEYDEVMEMSTAPNKDWTRRVQQIRKKVAEKKLRVLVTPRESYIGAQLLAAGIPQNDVEHMTVRSGMTEEQWKEVS